MMDAETQTESKDSLERVSDIATEGGRLPTDVLEMLRSPGDEAVQLRGIEALFAQRTEVNGSTAGIPTAAALQASAEAAVALFRNHPGCHQLLLKGSQFLTLLLAEASAQQQLPASLLFHAAQEVVHACDRLLSSESGGIDLGGKSGASATSKLMTWLVSLLALLLPCIGSRLQDESQSKALLESLFSKVIGPVLASADLAQEALTQKSVQVLTSFPVEPWIQKACLECGTVHSLALCFHRAVVGRTAKDSALADAIRVALRRVFAENLDLCVRAIDDTFIADGLVCVEVLDELLEMSKKNPGCLQLFDSAGSGIGKALRLWAFHQRLALEDSEPERCVSRSVLRRLSRLLSAVILQLPQQVLLQRMQENQTVETFQRLAWAAIHGNAQLKLHVAVNYLKNGAPAVLIACLWMFLKRYEPAPDGSASLSSPGADTEAAFRLLQDDALPAEPWAYIQHCLDICTQIVSHWAATKITLEHKASVLDQNAAPLLLAQQGLVDVLAEIVDPAATGLKLTTEPPKQVTKSALETLQVLFEQNGHICLFCMVHYPDAKQMLSLGCDSLAADPLVDFPDMQQQAVEQLAVSFEKVSAGGPAGDERLCRRIMKALSCLFESSMILVSWFLQTRSLPSLSEYQALDVHVEAVRAVARAPYWSADDAALLPDFVGLLCSLLLGSIHGLGSDAATQVSGASQRRILDLTEAEELVACSAGALLHLLLIDPSPPTVSHCLVQNLSQGETSQPGEPLVTHGASGPEHAVSSVMRVMQVFPSSDRVQMHCQHLLTSVLGE